MSFFGTDTQNGTGLKSLIFFTFKFEKHFYIIPANKRIYVVSAGGKLKSSNLSPDQNSFQARRIFSKQVADQTYNNNGCNISNYRN